MSEKICSKNYADDVYKFISDNNLGSSIDWLGDAIAEIFDGSDFEISLLMDEDFEDTMLSLEIHSDFASTEFWERMHRLCDAMLEGDHEYLFVVTCAFQRRGLR